jgi:hypothetical protein
MQDLREAVVFSGSYGLFAPALRRVERPESLSEKGNAFLLGGIAQVIVERGEGEREAQGKFEVGGIVDGQPVSVREDYRSAPSVQPSFRIFQDRQVGKIG